ncbi:uncharacterized protein JN550_008287 [Neoarthrinium moseri]|uniref:uncharacterized protein n=1 Tax=Neoarthrinium moseri TaxID=1658444 RepID=UPI001FDE4CCD|nr:uncharacterized protein JN550_008287 [Neoarthrinium moseri]KAI1865530.1 hypothetical protein JN550_008287 [Neoarthrinium moseri]
MSFSLEKSLEPRHLYGTEGENTPKAPASEHASTIRVADGYTMIKPGQMYRQAEEKPGRRQADYPHLHNLAESVFRRTKHAPLPIKDTEHKRREKLWNDAADAVREAIAGIAPGTHVAISANSGPHDSKLEAKPPSAIVPGAAVGLLLVAEFRKEAEPIHKDWYQVAIPIRRDEGRLLAGLRLIPTVLERHDLTYTVTNLTNITIAPESMSIVKDHPDLPYGSVANSWKPTNLGCWFHHGGLFESEYHTFKASFAWDGDLYGWDEAVLFTRKPISVISTTKPDRRFDHWSPDSVYENVNWLQVVDGQWRGGFQAVTRRADVITWDKHGIPQGKIEKY